MGNGVSGGVNGGLSMCSNYNLLRDKQYMTSFMNMFLKANESKLCLKITKLSIDAFNHFYTIYLFQRSHVTILELSPTVVVQDSRRISVAQR